ncbi:MAG: bifunctional diaminohydroxyphosphoribosylaminopyrimidine deaminase/5-amino-6-(5-phosphoribosylamino)uracil reductase RibD [Acidobacteriia bacterium]|nr:bifunctional diaminohydroxyphosphoribosylaminopyrimidine deaminase/5-amino-6-(5-phosphoribosylamino)uracil reductase RibD [Terriglobia bacterium]
MNPQDRKFMRRALALAGKSLGLASPNPPVGCVIAQGDEVVGQGWHEYATRDHAEVRALAEAGIQARGSTAYVTLEPCVHYGRTPPCASALIAAGVRRVIVARVDPNPIVSGKGIGALRAADIDVELGLLQAEAGRNIEPFACHVTTGLPLVVGKVGMSLDGRIAAAGNPGARITSDEARKFGQQLRLQLDALLVGIGTILADDPQLTYRGKLPKARPLITVVLDSLLRTPPGARLFRSDPAPHVLIFCRPDAPLQRRRELEAAGAEIVPVEHGPEGLDLNRVLRELGERKVLGLLVEGGSEVHWSFLSARLVDKFQFIIAPMVLGGRQAVPSVGGAGYPSAGEAPRFRISRSLQAGPDLILEAYPSYSRSILSPWLTVFDRST